ncbi:alpha/beta hydrolase [Pseudonocardia xishanensis]|uniref:Alpha/beta hydrolase n=1 Tax=Pseudonocardia xishanensis TaxID=630995 RepID=A0ABP8RUL4_9PSEU
MAGTTLAYDRAGSGPPALLLHGWPGDRSDWALVGDLLEADVIRPDLHGFGESAPAGDPSAAGQTAALVALLNDLDIDRVVVGGYDVGSRVAQTLAATHPDRVSALVLAPPLPGAGRRVLEPDAVAEFWYQSFHQLRLAEELVDGRADATRAYLRHFWDHWSGPAFTVSEERLDRLTARYARPGAFTASIGWYRAGAGMVRASLAEQPPADRLATPLTVLWPEFDPLFPRAWSDRVGDWFSAADLRPLDGVGHFSPVEAPQAWAAALTEVLT